MQEKMKTRQYVEVNEEDFTETKVNFEIDENGYYRRQRIDLLNILERSYIR